MLARFSAHTHVECTGFLYTAHILSQKMRDDPDELKVWMMTSLDDDDDGLVG